MCLGGTTCRYYYWVCPGEPHKKISIEYALGEQHVVITIECALGEPHVMIECALGEQHERITIECALGEPHAWKSRSSCTFGYTKGQKFIFSKCIFFAIFYEKNISPIRILKFLGLITNIKIWVTMFMNLPSFPIFVVADTTFLIDTIQNGLEKTLY